MFVLGFTAVELAQSTCVCARVNSSLSVSLCPADPAENSPADKKSKKATPTSESEFPKYAAAASFLLSQ